MTPDTPERRLAAILSADVVGYSRLMAEDEAATIRTLSDYREEVGMLVRQRRGRVVDFTGDNFLAEFPTALDATHCAVEIQRVLAARNADLPSERRMQFRIGIHLGDVTVEGDRIYGDGVNIAARLEGLAEPGGVCVSRTVHEQVRTKLALPFEDLGEQTVKNIAEPVHVYRVQWTAQETPRKTTPAKNRKPAIAATALIVLGLTAFGLWKIAIGPDSPTATDERFLVPGFGTKPAIAVLPFDNLSGDPEQEYFADGMAEELITRLSTEADFPVISRNSSFTYKGKAVDVKQVSRELGVRYVVEGSVRKAGGRVRITAQLIDAASGAHLWAETYDRELRDLFEIQDEITEAIAGSIGFPLIASEARRAMGKDRRDLDAYDSGMQGFWHMIQITQEDNRKARALFEKAIALNPQNRHASSAFANLAWTHYADILFQWTDSPAELLREQFRAGEQCVKLNSANASCHWVLAWAHSLSGQREEALYAAQLAVQLYPSAAPFHQTLGLFLSITGEPDAGIAHQEKAMRFSPRAPATSYYLHCIALGHFAAERYEEAVHWELEALQRTPDYWISLGTLASTYAHLGRMDEAKATLDRMLNANPHASAEAFRMIFSIADAAFIDSWLGGLRQAGWEG
jgi:adenylate cyclase